MKKEISFHISEDLFENFCLATKLMNEENSFAIEKCLQRYIAEAFGKMSKKYNSQQIKKNKIQKSFEGKANQRIPLWGLRKKQYNHKIIRSFFIAEAKFGEVKLSQMENLCSNENTPELYVPEFKNNYAQLKIDTAKSNGRVFEDDGDKVWIWEGVKTTLLNYKNCFYDSKETR